MLELYESIFKVNGWDTEKNASLLDFWGNDHSIPLLLSFKSPKDHKQVAVFTYNCKNSEEKPIEQIISKGEKIISLSLVDMCVIAVEKNSEKVFLGKIPHPKIIVWDIQDLKSKNNQGFFKCVGHEHIITKMAEQYLKNEWKLLEVDKESIAFYKVQGKILIDKTVEIIEIIEDDKLITEFNQYIEKGKTLLPKIKGVRTIIPIRNHINILLLFKGEIEQSLFQLSKQINKREGNIFITLSLKKLS